MYVLEAPSVQFSSAILSKKNANFKPVLLHVHVQDFDILPNVRVVPCCFSTSDACIM